MSFGLIIGLLCILYATGTIYDYFWVFEGEFWRLKMNLAVYSWQYWFVGGCISSVIFIIIAVLILMKKDRKALTFPLILWVAEECIYNIVVPALNNGFNALNLVRPDIAIILLLMQMNVLPARKAWFLPGAIFTVYFSYSLYSAASAGRNTGFSYFWWFVLDLFLFLYPYCLKGDLLNAKIAVPEGKPQSSQPQINTSVNAEELKKYYSLFKDGLLTEEEYKEKRKQILGEEQQL